MSNAAKVCLGCGAAFHMQPYDWPKNFAKRQFCGVACARTYGKKRQAKPAPSKTCVVCGNTFHKTQRGLARWKQQQACSTTCRTQLTKGRKRDTPWQVKHGRSHDRLYKIWTAMKQRCLNPKVPSWVHYGGRGITICERWMSFDNFAADMGDRPKDGTIERIDNNAGYSPENCRWASRLEQSNNIRSNRILTVGGVSKTTRQWERERGYKRGTIASRVNTYSWTDEEAVLTPPSLSNRRHRRVSA